jgi:F420-dependent oxidoreductase-like protein
VQLRIFTEPQQGASYADQLAVAKATEELGFDAYFRSDHYLAMGDRDGLPGPTDAWVTLAGLARETSRIRLGTLVSPVTFRRPGPLAITVAQVDAMSDGRVELGLGAGWFEAEHAAYGMTFPGVHDRFDQLTEQLAVITGLWQTPVGEPFSYEGAHYRITDSPALPKPIQQPRPPIVLGGHGARRTPALAAEYADDFNVGFSAVDVVERQFDRVREACDRAARDLSTLTFSVALVACCGRDEAEFRRRADAIGRDPAELREHGACGTPGEVLEALARYRAIGAQRAYLQILDLHDFDHLHLLADEVLPAVA